MHSPSGASAPDLTVTGICHHLALNPIVDEQVAIHTSAAGAEPHADLTIGYTQARGPVTLSCDEADADYLEQLALHAARAAAWLRGNGLREGRRAA